MGELTPRELLFQVREMADPDGSQIFDNDIARLQGIVTHIEGNLIVSECGRCQTAHSCRAAIFDCASCLKQICDSCKNEHRCNEVYCGHCDELTDHSTVNCVLPIVN